MAPVVTDLGLLEEIWELWACWNKHHPDSPPKTRFPNLVAITERIVGISGEMETISK